MSAKRIDMHQVKQLFQMYSQGISFRRISELSGISRNTIKAYLKRLKQIQLPLSAVLLLSEIELNDLFGTSSKVTVDTRHKYLLNRLEYFKKELNKTGVTKLLLWEEYRKEQPEGYGYTRFCHYLTQLGITEQAVMHFTHRPGEVMQVDFAGDYLSYVDRHSGEEVKCQVLVCVLPYSGQVYCRALASQKQEPFMAGIVEAMQVFGGVPSSIKIDNLKSGVSKANRYEPNITEALSLLSRHYQTTITTARVRKPRDKASVENAVSNVYRRVYAPLRHITFYSVEELNIAIKVQNNLFNKRLLQGKSVSRHYLFEHHEKDKLQPLPAEPFVFKHITHSKVQRNYHVLIGEDYHYYSVPYTFIGKQVKIVYCMDTVEIYLGLKRISIHKRSYSRHGYSTIKEHMPANHKAIEQQKGWNSEYFIQQATAIGPNTCTVIEAVLQQRVYKEQTYNSCLGILRLSVKYTPQRLEAACSRILPAGKYSYRQIESILSKKLDMYDSDQQTSAALSEHENIRGAQQYLF